MGCNMSETINGFKERIKKPELLSPAGNLKGEILYKVPEEKLVDALMDEIEKL